MSTTSNPQLESIEGIVEWITFHSDESDYFACGLALFFSAWIVIPAPTFFLLPLGVGALEVSPWLVGLNASTTWLGSFKPDQLTCTTSLSSALQRRAIAINNSGISSSEISLNSPLLTLSLIGSPARSEQKYLRDPGASCCMA